MNIHQHIINCYPLKSTLISANQYKTTNQIFKKLDLLNDNILKRIILSQSRILNISNSKKIQNIKCDACYKKTDNLRSIKTYDNLNTTNINYIFNLNKFDVLQNRGINNGIIEKINSNDFKTTNKYPTFDSIRIDDYFNHNNMNKNEDNIIEEYENNNRKISLNKIKKIRKINTFDLYDKYRPIEELSLNTINSVDIMKEIFNVNISPISCIYLFTLGSVKDLRLSMNIDKSFSDDKIVCKYGMTNNLARRTSEHVRTFKSIKNVKLHLKYYVSLDLRYIKQAESNISDYFTTTKCKLKYNGMKELVILDVIDIMNSVKKQLKNISNLYLNYPIKNARSNKKQLNGITEKINNRDLKLEKKRKN